jgi:hypothetical protein
MLLLFPGFSFERGPLDLTTKLLPTHDAPLLSSILECLRIGG